MKKFFKKGLACTLAFAVAVSGIVITEKKADAIQAADNEYILVWNDEFNGNSLDRSVWNVEVNGNGGGNNELQYYVDNTNNISVSNGTLKINALKQSYGGKQYTSGRITTQGNKEFKYGRMEAKMKLPSFTGAWPAFWMLGGNYSTVGWPACGEIDIMEAINTESKIYGTVHWSYQNNHAESGGNISGIDRTQWHVYAVEWTKNQIKWYVDDKNFYTQDISDEAEMEEFRRNYFIIFNLAIGGTWPGFTIDNTAFPSKSTMEVDYVRVYQKQSQYSGPTITVTEDAVEKVTGTWGSYFGSDWANASGSAVFETVAKDGFTLTATNIGTDRWGIQAYLKNLSYYAGNTYKYKCTITSDVDKTIFVKVAGDNDEEIYGEYINLKAGVPYNYEKDVEIADDYEGVLDLYFGLGRCEGDSADTVSATIHVKDISFTTTAEIPDPEYLESLTTQAPATTAAPTTKAPTTTANSSNNDTTVKTPGRTAVKKTVRTKNNKRIKITLRKIKSATRYQIKCSTTRKFLKKNTKTITTKKLVKTMKVRWTKKVCYVKARAYKVVNGERLYGKWSKIKKVKVNK